MKLLLEDWINEQLLIESRFSDALAYAQNFKKGAKQYRVRDVFEQMTDEQIKTFMNGAEKAIELAKTQDPSGDNKYLMWVARYVRKDLMRRLQKYSKNWGTSPIAWNDPEAEKGGTFDPDEMAKSITGHMYNMVGNLLPSIQDYHMLKRQKVIKRDIYDFDPTKEIGDFKNFITNAMAEFKEREQKAALKKKAAGEADDILDTEDYAVIRPNSEGASCYYGWGTRWCISARESRNYFNSYSGEGKSFYFVMFRHLANNSAYKKMALVYGRDQGYGNIEPEQVFDASDDEVGDVGLVDAITQNVLVKLLKQNDKIGSDYKRIKDEIGPLDQGQFSVLTDEIMGVIEDQDSNREMALEIGKTLFPDQYTEDIDLDIVELRERFDEMIQEVYSDIAGASAYHADENPAGPGLEQYQEKYDEYNFENIHVHYDEYDQGQYYWEGSYAIETADDHFADIKLPEDVDISEFADAVHKALDQSGMYPDEVEPDDYDNIARIRFTPDSDEAQGLDGFERFLERMSEYDDRLGERATFWDELSEKLMDAGLTTGGLLELRDILEDIDFKNVDFEIAGKEMNIWLEMEPILARPKGISGLYFGRMINTLAGDRTQSFPRDSRLSDPDIGSAPNVSPADSKLMSRAISDNTVNKIDKAIKDKYNAIWDQMALPGFERDETEAEDLDALPMIEMEFYPRPDKISQHSEMGQKVKMGSRHADKGAAGINLLFPHNLVMTLTNQSYWDGVGSDEDELAALVTFLKWIDQDEIVGQIQALLQESLNNMALEYVKKYPQRSAKELEDRGYATHWADVEEEPEEEPEPKEEEEEEEQIPGVFNEPQIAEQQLQKLYKRWAKMIK